MLVSFHFFEIFFREPVAEQGSVTDTQRYVDGDPLTSNASSLRKAVESPQRFHSPCNLFDTGMHSKLPRTYRPAVEARMLRLTSHVADPPTNTPGLIRPAASH